MSKKMDFFIGRDMVRAKVKHKVTGENKEDSEKTEEAPQISFDAPVNLTIVRDEVHNCLVGVNGKLRCKMLNGSMEPGEVWKCQILPGNYNIMPEAYPLSFEGKAEASEERPKAPVEKTQTKKKAEVKTKIEDTSELQRKLSDKTAKLNVANLKIGRMQRQINTLEKLKDENKQKESAIRSLKVQVQQLEAKLKPKNMDDVVSERDSLRTKVESQAEEIQRLRDTLALFNNGVRHSAVTTYLTGSTSIHCNLLEEKAYRVYFSPGRKTLRFIPDENGTVGCDSRDVVIPAIRSFTSFEKIRSLQARNEEGEVVISLE